MAANVPITVEINVAMTATINVLVTASFTWISWNNSRYHLKLNPSNIVSDLDELNEKKTRDIIGAYENNNTIPIIMEETLNFFILNQSPYFEH
jgi:hypothetical protein